MSYIKVRSPHKIIYCVFVVLSAALCCADSYGADFQQMSRGHFIIYHRNRSAANNILWKAEAHYKRIVSHIGIGSFRPWESKDKEKCRIYFYPSRKAYLTATGAPNWSVGLAHGNEARISLYEGVKTTAHSTLPHELTHILLRKLWGEVPIPVWLNEGMAQFEEDDKNITSHRKKYIKGIVRSGSYFKLADLFKMSGIPSDVNLFYAQSASIVDYLIKDNLRANFGRFLTMMRKGKSVDSALKGVFQWKYKNGIPDLEKRWVDYVRKRY